jgi:hypothetical protein
MQHDDLVTTDCALYSFSTGWTSIRHQLHQVNSVVCQYSRKGDINFGGLRKHPLQVCSGLATIINALPAGSNMSASSGANSTHQCSTSGRDHPIVTYISLHQDWCGGRQLAKYLKWLVHQWDFSWVWRPHKIEETKIDILNGCQLWIDLIKNQSISLLYVKAPSELYKVSYWETFLNFSMTQQIIDSRFKQLIHWYKSYNTYDLEQNLQGNY